MVRKLICCEKLRLLSFNKTKIQCNKWAHKDLSLKLNIGFFLRFFFFIFCLLRIGAFFLCVNYAHLMWVSQNGQILWLLLNVVLFNYSVYKSCLYTYLASTTLTEHPLNVYAFFAKYLCSSKHHILALYFDLFVC